MTVAELIAELQQYPPDCRVLVDGYEGGLADPRLRRAMARIGVPVDFGGAHSLASEAGREGAIPVVVLTRENEDYDPHGDDQWPDAR